jgi:DNA-cytosine methyltransferase
MFPASRSAELNTVGRTSHRTPNDSNELSPPPASLGVADTPAGGAAESKQTGIRMAVRRVKRQKQNRDVVNVVDLFSGCGGLSLGFELFEGDMEFDVRLAADNDPAVVRCFNDNHPVAGEASVGRVADLTWFSHPTEALLYYLSHLALSGDEELRVALDDLGFSKFLAELKDGDDRLEVELMALAGDVSFKRAVIQMSDEALRLATVKASLARIGVSSLKKGRLARSQFPWVDEYLQLSVTPQSSPIAALDLLAASATSEWSQAIDRLGEASEREGKKQHSANGRRVREVVDFLKGDQGARLRSIWVAWKAKRDTLRADFCLTVGDRLNALYLDGRRVGLILGGPPCKGFSRIARPVLASLREQGASAWSCKEYGDERNALMHQYVLFLQALRPSAFLFENVSNFASTLRTPTGSIQPDALLQETISDLTNHELEYVVHSQIVRAKQHAVPQDRDRFIMVGFLHSGEQSAIADNFFNLAEYAEVVPLQIALQGLGSPHEFFPGGKVRTSDLVNIESTTVATSPGSLNTFVEWIARPMRHGHTRRQGVDAHVYRRLREDDRRLLKKFGSGQRWMDYLVRDSTTLNELREVLELVHSAVESEPNPDLPSKEQLTSLLGRVSSSLSLRLLLEDMGRHLPDQDEHHLLHSHYMSKSGKDHGDWMERLSASRPCKTVIAHIGKDTYSYFHPYENRALTIREVARVQSFPDSFRFGTCGIVDAYSMIGNAVPPLLAHAFAERFATLHKSLGIFGPRTETQHVDGRLFDAV